MGIYPLRIPKPEQPSLSALIKVLFSVWAKVGFEPEYHGTDFAQDWHILQIKDNSEDVHILLLPNLKGDVLDDRYRYGFISQKWKLITWNRDLLLTYFSEYMSVESILDDDILRVRSLEHKHVLHINF